MAKTPSSGIKASKPSGKSVSAAGKATPNKSKKRDSMVSLRRDIDDIVLRLKRADSLTQQSVASLKTAFGVLERRVGEETQINKAALTLRVDQLSSHLTGLIKTTQEAVAKDLRQTRNNPSIEHLKLAVAAAEKRMADTELAQADALGKVNRHIADLAKAIDTRLTQDARERKEGFERLTVNLETTNTKLDNRIKDVELASAQAIVKLGERMVAVSDEFKDRTDANANAVSARLTDIAQKTQKEFEAYRKEIQDYRTQFERRVESLEESQRNLDSYTDRSLAGITNRIDNLEYGLTTVAPPSAAPGMPNESVFDSDEAGDESSLLLDDPFAPDAEEPLDLSQATEGSLFDPAPVTVAEPQRPPLSLVPTTPEPTPVAPIHQPYIPPSQNRTVNAGPDEFVPTEYVPEALAPKAPAHPLTGYSHNSPASAETPFAPFTSGAPSADTMAGPEVFMAPDSLVVLDEEDLPYDDPAYAENDSLKRPGSFKSKKKKPTKKQKKEKLKADKTHLGKPSKVIKLAGLAAVIAAGAYIGLRTVPKIMGSNDLPTFDQANTPGQPSMGAAPIAQVGVSPDISPAVGDYQDNQGLGTDGAPAEAGTLEAAARDGDPVAEFQLGLSHLQAGRTSSALQLIRSSANKGQPAAQYRLAKIYEAGDGVTTDPAMARQLTERSARNGNRIAMHDLALYYAEGRGDVSVDIKTAAKWFEKAAQRGVVDSQYNLGVLFESGQGLPKDFTQAYVWYGIAANQGDQYAQKQLETLKGNMAVGDVAKAEKRVKGFKPVAIDEPANGIFRNVSWATPQRQKDAKVYITETQRLLGQLGYDAGTPDGSMGPKTRTAILNFQKEKGLNPTGEVNQALMVQLQKAVDA